MVDVEISKLSESMEEAENRKKIAQLSSQFKDVKREKLHLESKKREVLDEKTKIFAEMRRKFMEKEPTERKMKLFVNNTHSCWKIYVVVGRRNALYKIKYNNSSILILTPPKKLLLCPAPTTTVKGCCLLNTSADCVKNTRVKTVKNPYRTNTSATPTLSLLL
jgi:hypothetical protein